MRVATQRNETEKDNIMLRHRIVLATGLACLVGVGFTTVGLAARSNDPSLFTGVAAAQHARSTVDALDPRLAATIEHIDARYAKTDPNGRKLIDESAAIGQLPNGRELYIVPTSTDRLCALASLGPDRAVDACTTALSTAQPVVLAAYDSDGPSGPAGPLVFGIVRDGITSVTFSLGGRSEQLAVHGNMVAVQLPAGVSGPLAGVSAS